MKGTLVLQPPNRSRERVLLIGPWGAGKSTAWGVTWEWMKRTGADYKMYVIDTDRAADRVAPDLPLEQVADVWHWEEYISAIDKFSAVATRDDILVVDLIDKAWAAVQDDYIEQVFSKGAATFFLEWKKSAAKGNPLSDAYGTNWQVINRRYGEFIDKVIHWPGHIIACSPAEPVAQPNRDGSGGDGKDILEAFGRFGVKPAGQKRIGFQFLTVQLMIPKGNDSWSFTTMKDVGLGTMKREKPVNQPLKDWVMDYLVGIAGWTL